MTIKATILADSITVSGKRITSFELEYPRFIHAEVMTHRQFSRNAASSRAIPASKVIDQVRSNPAMPIYWGSSKPGMQAGDELSDIIPVKSAWIGAAYNAAESSEQLSNLGLHKQHTNRITEPFQQYKIVLTATEFDNFFYLRSHPDAQPEIRALSDAMYSARQESTPQILSPGEYHLPYVQSHRENGELKYYTHSASTFLPLDQALAISASACAQVSYRVLDLSLDKALDIYQRLVESKPVHASPFEHQATPMQTPIASSVNPRPSQSWELGVTHCDRNGNLWSGNLQGWIQHRQLIPDNVCINYAP